MKKSMEENGDVFVDMSGMKVPRMSTEEIHLALQKEIKKLEKLIIKENELKIEKMWEIAHNYNKQFNKNKLMEKLSNDKELLKEFSKEIHEHNYTGIQDISKSIQLSRKEMDIEYKRMVKLLEDGTLTVETEKETRARILNIAFSSIQQFIDELNDIVNKYKENN